MLFHVEPRDTTEVLNCIASTSVPSDVRILALPNKPCINRFQKVINYFVLVDHGLILNFSVFSFVFIVHAKLCLVK